MARLGLSLRRRSTIWSGDGSHGPAYLSRVEQRRTPSGIHWRCSWWGAVKASASSRRCSGTPRWALRRSTSAQPVTMCARLHMRCRFVASYGGSGRTRHHAADDVWGVSTILDSSSGCW